ncbi:MAG: VacB/RNase II family 3'-5' exoribonuclease, partial [Planctomycetes bacterium]|nr:VacB/RNase II family 3'-5' exoribonuclease [Planctomycetota bacterium]
ADLERAGRLLVDDERGGRVTTMERAGCVVGRVRLGKGGDPYLFSAADRRSFDLYAGDLRGAPPGDQVAARVQRRSKKRAHPLRADDRERATVVKVLQERTRGIFGVVEGGRRGEPRIVLFDQDYPRTVDIHEKDADRVRVGDMVEVGEVLTNRRFPTARRVTVVGDIDDPAADADFIMRAFGIDPEWPAEALLEARAFPAGAPLSGREDLTRETVVTVDPEDAKDFDDAVSIRALDGGSWELGVHIADVSHFVQPGTALDREALRRGNTCYLPGRTVPMLPERLSNDLCSLRPGEVRFTKSAFITIDGNGDPVDWRLSKTAIRSARRFSYPEVMDLLEGRPVNDVTDAVRALVLRMRDLARIMKARRTRRGALVLEMHKGKVWLRPDHLLERVEPEVQDLSHSIIEEFMLAANVAVASTLHRAGLPGVYRVHPRPQADDLDDFRGFVEELGYRRGAGGKGDAGAFEMQDVIAWIHGQPEQHAVNYALLRSLKQAEYSPFPEGHFALAERDYCHFTSPIRRYPDLVVHQVLDQWLAGNLGGKEIASFGFALPGVARGCSYTERQAEQAERELAKMKVLRHLQSHIGAEFGGTITGVAERGLFVELDEYFTDGMIPLRGMGAHHATRSRFAASVHTDSGAHLFRLGDRVNVLIASIDLIRREMDLELLSRERRDRAGVVSAKPAPGARQERARQPTKQRRKNRNDRSRT